MTTLTYTDSEPEVKRNDSITTTATTTTTIRKTTTKTITKTALFYSQLMFPAF